MRLDPPTGNETCPLCNDPLDLHIGNKPCVGTYTETYAERRARMVREQEQKRRIRLFGKDAM